MSSVRGRWWRANGVASRPPSPSWLAKESAEEASHFDQTGESAEAGSDLQQEMVDQAVVAGLQGELAAVVRAEARIADGTFGLSVESGARIPDDRLEAEPLAERTVEEQARFERSQR